MYQKFELYSYMCLYAYNNNQIVFHCHFLDYQNHSKNQNTS